MEPTEEFLKANWGILIQALIAILTLIAMYHIYGKGKNEERIIEEKEYRENVLGKISKLEGTMETLVKIFPPLKDIEKLEESLKKLDQIDKLSLTPQLEKMKEEELKENIRQSVSEILKAAKITPEAITSTIEEKVKEISSEQNKLVAEIVAQKLDEVDERYKEPVGHALDYVRLGSAEIEKRDYQKALEYYEKAIQLKPDYVEAWNNKGVALNNLGHYEEALEAFEKAIQLKPDYTILWSNKGSTLRILNRHIESLTAIEKALTLRPDDPFIWGSKGLTLHRLGYYEEAIKSFGRAIELDPNDDRIYYYRACTYSLKGDKQNALEDLSRSIKFNTDNKEMAKSDLDFRRLWKDEEFKKIVG